ncbi:MAG: S-layer homology domain-containing protein [Clostridia bacterium]|nr:S-layer homology domain-containing protein [Clostridia bacterium]
MKKLIFGVLLMMVSLSLVLSVSADGDSSLLTIADGATHAAPLTPALNIIAADFDMAKAGLIGHSPVFSRDDFCRALNLTSVESITLTALPDATVGRLLLGSTAVSVGQTVSGANLDALIFSPASDEKSVSSFSFTVGDRGYALSCSVYMLDRINASPSVSQAAGITLDVDTHSNTACFGKLSASDPEGDALRFTVVSYPRHGVLMITDTAAGEYVYLPEKGFAGKDAFSYVVRDKYGNYSGSANVSLTVSRASTEIVYSDMVGSSANNAALTLAENGIMNGVQKGEQLCFEPSGEVSRVDFTVMVMKSAGITDLPDAKAGFFDDSDISASAMPYVAAAKQLGYIDGVKNEAGELCFLPNEALTRAEAALIVSRVIDSGKLLGSNAASPSFSDAKDVPVWAETSVANLNQLGILSDDNGRIDAAGKLSRADAAVMLAAVLKLK